MTNNELSDLKKKLEEMETALKSEKDAKIIALETQKVAEEKAKKALEAQKAADENQELPLPMPTEKIAAVLHKKWLPYYKANLVIASIILIMLCVVFFFKGGVLLNRLKDVDYARGLITFIFSVGTIGIGILLTLSALRPGKEEGEAFNRGKEIFTILVGILGTIIGFYFGSSELQAKKEITSLTPLTVAEIQSSNITPDENTQITISSEIGGGTPPYRLKIDFDPKLIKPIEETRSSEGKFMKQITMPQVDKDEEVKIELVISDEDGKEIRAKAIPITIKNIK